MSAGAKRRPWEGRLHMLGHVIVLLPALGALAGATLVVEFLARQLRGRGPLSYPYLWLAAIAALAVSMALPIGAQIRWLVGTLVAFPVFYGLLLAKALTARR